MYNVLLLCAGASKRFDKLEGKSFVNTWEKPLVFYPLETFSKHDKCAKITLITKGENISKLKKIVEKYSFDKVINIIDGGENRVDSVKTGVNTLANNDDILAVHAITYPFVTIKELDNVYFTALEDDGAVLGSPLEDSIKVTNETLHITETKSREHRWITHAPTMASQKIWHKAYKSISYNSNEPSDEAAILSNAGFSIQIVPDFRSNFPIYTTFDWERLQSMKR